MKIRINSIIIFLLLIPIFQPKLFTQIPAFSFLYIILNLLVFTFLSCKLILQGGRMPNIIGIWLSYRVYLLFIGIINGRVTGILQWGYLTLVITCLMLIFEIYGFSDFTTIVKFVAVISVVLLALNYYTLLIFPRGVIQSTFYEVEAGDYYLLGIKTQFTTMMFPALSASSLYMYIKRNWNSKVLFGCSIVFCLLNIFNKSISTAIVGIFLYIGLFAISHIFKFKYNEWICLVTFFVFNILVVFFRIQDLMASFIINVLHKDTTMSSRVNIWDSAIHLLNNQNIIKWLFGNGIFKDEAFVPFGSGLWQPHNQLLALIYSGGIVGTVFFITFIFLLLKVRKQLDGIQSLLMVCLCVLVLSVTEVYFGVAFSYIPFILMFYYQKFCDNKECANILDN